MCSRLKQENFQIKLVIVLGFENLTQTNNTNRILLYFFLVFICCKQCAQTNCSDVQNEKEKIIIKKVYLVIT